MSSLSYNAFQQPKTGDSLDIFSLHSRLHEGALATLFLAEDRLSRAQVVLKIPCGDILNHPLLLYHYQNEERISRLLDHPGIIQFIHRQRSRQYIIMEYVLGKDFRSWFGENRSLGLDTALVLMDQLCEVIRYLHDQSIVHLDLKPENIIYCNDSTIKVIDFGLASCRNLPDLLRLDLNIPLGTPWYIAPEQLLGERTDPRCDIYAMGMLFYEMLCGKLPWPRSSKIHIARRRLRHDPIPPRYHNPNIPPQIQNIIFRAISRHAKDRYASVADFQHDLNCWQQLPITVTGSTAKRPPLWKRLFPGKAVEKSRKQQLKTNISSGRPQLVGALIDSAKSDIMVAELKKQALVRSADVTLLHVVEEKSDSHVRRYGIAVEGEKLMTRLEKAVQLFRRYGIDPTIRLVRGEVVAVLVELCIELDAKLLVLGRSRKKEGFLRSASVRRRLEKNCPCPLTVAEKQQFSAATDLSALQPNQLTAGQVLICDIFLVDLWYEHLHSHTAFIYQLLLHPERDRASGEEHCGFGRFLASLDTFGNWGEVTSVLRPVHRKFHQMASQMAQLCEHDHSRLHDIYIRESFPLSCILKKELGNVSRLLRAHLDRPPPSVPFLVDEVCPVGQPALANYGPLLGALNLDQDLCVLSRKSMMARPPSNIRSAE